MTEYKELVERLLENIIDEGSGPMLSVLDNDGEIQYQLLTPDLADLVEEMKAALANDED